MYTIKSYKNFWKDFVVERNLTHPKDDCWSYFNCPCKIVFVWDDCEYGSLINRIHFSTFGRGLISRGTYNQEYFSLGGRGGGLISGRAYKRQWLIMAISEWHLVLSHDCDHRLSWRKGSSVSNTTDDNFYNRC